MEQPQMYHDNKIEYVRKAAHIALGTLECRECVGQADAHGPVVEHVVSCHCHDLQVNSHEQHLVDQ